MVSPPCSSVTQQQLKPLSLTSSAVQATPSVFIPAVVQLTQGVYPEVFRYQQEVYTIQVYSDYYNFYYSAGCAQHLLWTLQFDHCLLIATMLLYNLSPTHSHWGHCPGHKCFNCEGNMAVDEFWPSSLLLQHHHCDLPSWGRWWVLPAAQWPSSNWSHSHWPPVQYKLHHQCSHQQWFNWHKECTQKYFSTSKRCSTCMHW